MANNGNVIGQFSEEVEQTAGEVAQDVKDQVGQALEQGVQSVAGKQLTPQQIQQKKADEQKRLMWARRVINYYKNTEAAVQKVRQVHQQKEQQRLKEWEERNKKDAEKRAQRSQRIISPAKQTPRVPGQQPVQQREDILRSQQELRSGRGIGG